MCWKLKPKHVFQWFCKVPSNNSPSPPTKPHNVNEITKVFYKRVEEKREPECDWWVWCHWSQRERRGEGRKKVDSDAAPPTLPWLLMMRELGWKEYRVLSVCLRGFLSAHLFLLIWLRIRQWPTLLCYNLYPQPLIQRIPSPPLLPLLPKH